MDERRIGVYICHCGNNIAGTVDVEAVAEFAARLESVVVARHYKYMCSDQGQDLIKNDIREQRLNRVVVASCSPRMHGHTFAHACQNAGLNPYLFEMANIREHCSWVHKDGATSKAKILVSAAVRKVYYYKPLEIKNVPVNSNVLVIGGGIAGIQAALEIADSEHTVYLVEKEPTIGGHMAQFDKTFPTLDCSACILTPKMTSIAHHPFIKLMTYSEVVEISGFVGNFKATIKKKPRYVDVDKCTGCGICTQACVLQNRIPSEFDVGLGKRGAIYIPFPQAVPLKAIIDSEKCLYLTKGKCKMKCLEACERNAIQFEQGEERDEIEVGSIIVATGFQSFDPSIITQYGYGRYDNVITALQFERLCNASGPTGGKIVLKDGSEPKNIAIVHCVGSRDQHYHEYCSRVCCMYALKYSHLLLEKITEANVFQFYIDLRCAGKGYEEFYNRLQTEGVHFIRGRVAEITDVAETTEEKGKLMVVCEDTLIGCKRRISADMIILCTGLEPRADADAISRILNIGKSPDGFFLERHPKLEPVSTATDGILVVGCCQGPKDIPDTVAQSSAGAARALAMISKGNVEIEPIASAVDEELCSGCKTCISLCSFNAISFNDEKKVASINEALCKGCGVCAAACPSGAITSKHFTGEQIMAQIEGVFV